MKGFTICASRHIACAQNNFIFAPRQVEIIRGIDDDESRLRGTTPKQMAVEGLCASTT
jgi:hypothetical protein